jgi:hypothetical protein
VHLPCRRPDHPRTVIAAINGSVTDVSIAHIAAADVRFASS